MNYVTLLKKYTWLDNTNELETVMLCRKIWSGPLLQSFDWVRWYFWITCKHNPNTSEGFTFYKSYKAHVSINIIK